MKKGRAHGPAPRACAAARGEAAAGTLPGADERGGGGAAAARGAELLPEPGGGGTGADAVPAGEVPAVLQLESAKEKSDQDFRVLCRDFLIRLKVATGRRAQA